jgi:hypothetical protein
MPTFHQTDANGVYLYSQEYANKPHGGVSVAVPDIPAGSLAVWETDVHVNNNKQYGEPNTGQWVIKADNRNTELYRTDTGEKFTLNDEYNGIGDIPDWLTDKEKPGQFYDFVNGDWVKNEAAEDESLASQARAKRDQLLAASDFSQLPDAPVNAEAWAVYRQALRDVPDQVGFPHEIDWPVAP